MSEFVLSLFRGLIERPAPTRPSRHEIVVLISARHGLSPDILRSPDRTRRTAWPRQEAMWLMSWHGYSPGQIGHALNRTTWTVAHGIERHAQRVEGVASL